MQQGEYDRQQLRRKLQQNDVGSRYAPLSYSVGLDVQRRSTLQYTAEDTIATISGANLALININTDETRYLLPLDGHGIACFAIHPQRMFVAVGERGMDPNIYIYTYPTLQIVKVLRGGTTYAYSDLAFNASGDKLASVGSAPDYMLTVWDWENERTLLHAKAFGQEVFKVAFSQDDDNRLTTCGTGHIRFWKMASTFTGLKLQGAIGKFGKVELTDISSFVELPDGKVVSTSEAGALLLWEGSFIKCRLVRPGKDSCHDGAVRMLLHARDEDAIISAGDDGVIRWWDFNAIDMAEVDSDNSMDLELTPTWELVVGDGAKIQWLERSRSSDAVDSHFLCVDLSGFLWRAPLAEGGAPTVLKRTHTGTIRSVDASPTDSTVATCGEDGTVVLWELRSGTAWLRAKFLQPATAARWAMPNGESEAAVLVVGFADGVVRLLQRGESSWVLLQAEKPHNTDIVAVLPVPSLNGFCTSSKDGTIFFFEFSDVPQTRSCSPLGFVNLASHEDTSRHPAIATALDIRANGSHILCACNDGTLRELDVRTLRGSANEDAEGADSLELKPQITVVAFSPEELFVLHHDLRPVEKKAEDAADEPAAEEAENASEQPPSPTNEMRNLDLSVVGCSYLYRAGSNEPHGFVFSTTGGTSGTLFEVRTRDMQLARAYIAADPPSVEHDIGTLRPTRSLRRMSHAAAIVTASQDGSVTVRSMDALQCFSRITAHDQSRGGCVEACISKDGKHLVTVGHDAILNVFALDLQNFNSAVRAAVAMPTNAVEEPPLFVVSRSGRNEQPQALLDESMALAPIAEDISDPQAYSIREVKARKEEGSRQQAANQHKAYFKTLVEAIRKEFRSILAENARQPPEVQLDRAELNVDLDYYDILEEKKSDAIEEVHKINAHNSDRAWKLRTKLQQYFWDPVLVPSMRLRGFHSHDVRSLRTRQLEQSVSQIVSLVQMNVKRDEMARLRAGSTHQEDESNLQEGAAGEITATAERMNGLEDADLGSTYAARKVLRGSRKAEIAAHVAAKPDESQDDPRDLEAINTAIATLGDYSLKSSEDYEVPESQRVNAEKKRRQMAMLEESLVSMRLGFNERFLALRLLKYHINAMIKAANERIREIDRELGQPECSEQLWEPSIAPDEFVADITDISPDEVKAYRHERATKPWETAKAPAPTTFTSSNIQVQLDENTGGYTMIKDLKAEPVDILKIGEHSDEHEPPGIAPSPREANGMQQEHLKFSVVENVLDKRIEAAEDLTAVVPVLHFAQQCVGKLPSDDKPEWPVQRLAAHQEKLRFERAALLNYVEENVRTFDDAVFELRRDRLQVMSDLKIAELRLLVCFEEYLQLLQFESRDVALQQRQVRARTEKDEIRTSISELQARLQAKQVEMAAWEEKAAALLGDCVALVPTTHPFHEHLLKIFKRKIKRRKNKLDDDSLGDDQSDYDDDDDLSDEDDEFDDSCPPGCDTGLYEQVIELREKRLDMEDVLQDVQAISNDIKRNYDRLVVREKQIDKDIAQTELEVTQFQKEKQQALNKIELAVPLRMSQIFCFPRDDARGDISDVLDALPMKSHVLIPLATLNKLERRITELSEETTDARQQFKSLQKHQVTLTKQLQVYKERIEHWTEKCQELQLLKFGQLVDLDHIDALNDRTDEEAAEATVRELEQEHNLRVAQMTARDNQLKKAVHQQVVRNTGLLNQLADCTEQQMQLESTLNASTVISGIDEAKEQRALAVERAKLMSQARAQAREIESLKMEITMLRRKEAVLYAPPNPPPPVSSRQCRPVHVPTPTLPSLVEDRSKLAVSNSIASAGSSARRLQTS